MRAAATDTSSSSDIYEKTHTPTRGLHNEDVVVICVKYLPHPMAQQANQTANGIAKQTANGVLSETKQ